MWIRSLGREDLLEEAMATNSSILTWRIPWTEDPGRLQSMGSQRVRYNWLSEHCCVSKWSCTYTSPSVSSGNTSLTPHQLSWPSGVWNLAAHQVSAMDAPPLNVSGYLCWLACCDKCFQALPGLHSSLPKWTLSCRKDQVWSLGGKAAERQSAQELLAQIKFLDLGILPESLSLFLIWLCWVFVWHRGFL